MVGMVNPALTRRRFLRQTLTALPALALVPHAGRLFAQAAGKPALPAVMVQARAAAAKAVIVNTSLRGGVSMLAGSGGNIAVLPGSDGVLVVDAGYASSQPQLQQALALISGQSLHTLINTHWHFDHTDGNLWMHGAGATIVAHENTRKHLSQPTEIAAFHSVFPALPSDALPTQVFATTRTLKHGGNTLELTHYAPAHTDSDISIRFAEPNVIHVGDTLFSEGYPFIDYSTGGSIDGMIAATRKNIAACDKSTIVIAGHGKPASRDDLQAVLLMLQTSRDNVAALKKEGKSLEETVAAEPTASLDARWGQGFMKPAAFVGLVYQGV